MKKFTATMSEIYICNSRMYMYTRAHFFDKVSSVKSSVSE